MKPITCCSIPILVVSLLGTAGAWATLSDYKAAVTNEASLISNYTFDQSNANDSRGLNHGIVQGGATYQTGITSASQALRLDGTGRVNLGTVRDFNFADTTGSVEAWVRVDWPGTFSVYDPCLFANRNGGPVTWIVHMNRDKSGMGMWNGTNYFPTFAVPAPRTNDRPCREGAAPSDPCRRPCRHRHGAGAELRRPRAGGEGCGGVFATVLAGYPSS